MADLIDQAATAATTSSSTAATVVIDASQQQQPPATMNLIDKVSKFKQGKAAAAPAQTADQNSFFDYKDLEKITDPVAKKFAEDAYKSMQAGLTRKTQAIADKERSFEQKLQEMANWSPERIQRELLNNPQFLQAAQQLQGQTPQGTIDEQSLLSPQEKARIDALQSKINSLEQGNFQAQVTQRDTQLQGRYSDYNPAQVDQAIANMAQMSPLDIREHVYKSLKHDEDVAAAYELGRKEALELNTNKMNAITQSADTTTVTADGLPTREKGETDQAWFMKLANFRLAQFKNKGK